MDNMKDDFDNSRRLFYCPECGDIHVGLNSLRGICFIGHPRDGYGRPISFFKCKKCGNVLAGSMDITGWSEESGTRYASMIIEGYNEGGTYYNNEFHEYCKKHLGE